jgi:hypothetical protein
MRDGSLVGAFTKPSAIDEDEVGRRRGTGMGQEEK